MTSDESRPVPTAPDRDTIAAQGIMRMLVTGLLASIAFEAGLYIVASWLSVITVVWAVGAVVASRATTRGGRR